MKKIIFSAIVGAACAAFTPSVMAQSTTADKYYVTVKGTMTPVTGTSSLETTLTFSGPVQLPKIKLAAGTYLFEMISSNVMRVSSEDGKQVFTSFSTVPTTRTRIEDHAQVRLQNIPGGAAPKLIGLYPENSSTGFQPV